MDQSWENWTLHMEMDEYDEDLLEQCRNDGDDEFLRDILQEPGLSSESETQSFQHVCNSNIAHNNFIAEAKGSSLSPEEMALPGKRARPSSSPRTYILSFDKSTIIPATPEPHQLGDQGPPSSKSNSSRKRTLQENQNQNQNLNLEPKQKATQGQGGKKGRTDSQILDHIMAERKRRQELTERFIALSATIPGLKKTDKASILREAINYVKQLQERVIELEKQNKGGTKSMIFVKKTDVCANEDTSSGSSETSSEDCSTPSELLPDVQARVLGKEVLIEIHCEKENGIEREILDQLENLNLCVTGSSVLPFGNSTLGVTIIAKMGEAYEMTVNDLVKNLRQVLLNHMASYTDPY